LQAVNTDQFLYLIKTNPEEALQSMYKNYYGMLCNQVFLILKDKNSAEDIVQDVFFEIWKKKDTLSINQSLVAYLKRACRNRTLNYIRDNNVKWEDDTSLMELQDSGVGSDEIMTTDELNTTIQNVIAQLPEKCGIIFSLSRFEDMSYNEIASSLDISVKTVENQISKALRILREKIYKNKYVE
jgi:RNA polymerase sigma-70 factor (ECF subfamily)